MHVACSGEKGKVEAKRRQERGCWMQGCAYPRCGVHVACSGEKGEVDAKRRQERGRWMACVPKG